MGGNSSSEKGGEAVSEQGKSVNSTSKNTCASAAPAPEQKGGRRSRRRRVTKRCHRGHRYRRSWRHKRGHRR